ncbi:hypothetical protein ABZT43_50470 [Streptomyces sp. NPDC005349]|uniref:hypothetical protein n=1 Tax=Streptomyces sp. NPDC005349 TaxID=3157037 RepID=UPI0033B33189
MAHRRLAQRPSRYGAAPGEARPLTSRSVTNLDITVLAATEQPTGLPPQPTETGRRSQVFRLLADASADQEWTPLQIADALKIVRSLSAQMGQWITQKFLIRTGRGRYRPHPQWARTPQLPAKTPDSIVALAA